MTAEIGQYALILALMVSAVGGVLTLAGAELASRSWMRVGMAAAAVLAVLATIAIGALAWGFVESDFSILNVARNSNIALPWYYKLAAVWGSHEGSILFWVTTLAWWIFAVALSARHLPERVLARILGTLFIITFGLYLFILTTSNPFLRLFPPAEAGADLNPLLQDPGMIFHPPLLYLGYVGFAVPFAFAVAALLGGRLDVAWARWMRPFCAEMYLWQHRIIPALRLKHRSGSCRTSLAVSALRIMRYCPIIRSIPQKSFTDNINCAASTPPGGLQSTLYRAILQ